MTTAPVLEAIYSQDAEDAVIGAVLIAPETFAGLHAILAPSDFFIVRHRTIWELAAKLDAAGTTIDVITLGHAIKDAGATADIPASYLLNLVNNTPTHVRAEDYAQLVKRASVRRQLLDTATQITALAHSSDLATEAVMEQASAALANVAALTVSDFTDAAELVDAHMAKIERAMEHPGTLAGIPSVIPALGKTLGGYQPGRVYLVAARPGVGKTSFLVSEALHMAQLGKRVAFQSIEMTKDDLVTAFIAQLAGIPAKVIQEATMTPPQYSAYVKAAGQFGKLPIFIDDLKVTPKQMAAKVRKLIYRKGVDVLMADYVQLFKTPAGVKQDPYERVTAISIELAELAKTLSIPILAAAQLNRQSEQRGDKRPQLSDLRDSGQLEQDAAVVLFPYRPAMFEAQPDTPPQYEEAEIAVAKNRFGPTGMVRCAFRPVLKQFIASHTVNLSTLAEGRAS
jgi:replicative DNA helicase